MSTLGSHTDNPHHRAETGPTSDGRATAPSTAPPTREQAREYDRADPLAAFRKEFLPSDEDTLVYLDGNSLGRPPRRTAERINSFVTEQWAGRLIQGWAEGWMEMPERVGDRIGEVALGAAPGQVAVAESTTVCLYKLLHAAARARPGRNEIVTDLRNFPTDRYLVESVAGELDLTVRWIDSDLAGGVTTDQLAEVLSERAAVVTLSHVAYQSGYLADMPALTQLCHRAGALTVWDLSHSVGAVPMQLDAAGVDFATGCSYKFLNGGPGAPAFAYVRAEHQETFRQPIWGWLGRADPFAMEQGYRPAPGIRSMLSGTPSVLGMLGVEQGIELVAEAGIEAIRAKSVALGEMAAAACEGWLAPHGLRLASPTAPAERGAHVTIQRADGYELAERFIAAGLVVDFRAPDGIRLGLAPLSTGFEDLWWAINRMAEILAVGQ